MKVGALVNGFSWTKRSSKRRLSKGSRYTTFVGTKFRNTFDTPGEQGLERHDDIGYPLVNNPYVKNDAVASWDQSSPPPMPAPIERGIRVTSNFSVQSSKASSIV